MRTARVVGTLLLTLTILMTLGATAAAAASPIPVQGLLWTRPQLDTQTSRLRGVPAPVPWTGTYNVYRTGAFVTQKTDQWCVGASSQMMLNLINGTNDTSYAAQAALMAYARAHEIQPSSEPGADPRGWANTLTHAGAGAYKDQSFSSMDAALAYAAKRILLTGKPVGLLVGLGSHAWVMTGFAANHDPRLTSNYLVSSVYISGPLYPMQVAKLGYFDLKPDTRLSRAQMAQVFLPYREPGALHSWLGAWVIVAP
jgi:hypothetical protein